MRTRRSLYTFGCLLALCLVGVVSAKDESSQDASPISRSIGAYFVHKTVIIPHDDKKHRGGEDAASTSPQFLVVADGVGGWVQRGVNPGLYSKLLTKSVMELGERNTTLSLTEIVHAANWLAADQHLGSATCTTLKLTGKNTIQALNIGDSGYSIHRRNEKDQLELVFASEPGQKRFNFPNQLGGKHGDDVKDVGVERTHTLDPDDVIVIYSDGVSDNLFPAEFHSCLDSAVDDEDETLQSFSLAADCIARNAYFLGKDKTFDSPFAQGARAAGWGNSYRGGKHDDITVVVAQIRAGAVPQVLTAEEDPYFDESITLYTGPVGALEDLPTLEDLKRPVREEL
jgi:protein phosphatase PTC7